MVLAVVILLAIFLYVTRKKRMARGLDSQVVKSSKYKSLNASFGQPLNV